MITEESVLGIIEKKNDSVIINLYNAIKQARKNHYTEGFMCILVKIGVGEVDNKKMEEVKKNE